jgi:4-diphosphocytidyl-2-C-methyl-D-erythritol kinase
VACNNPLVPKGEDNLVFKAALFLQAHSNRKSGVSISIKKKIPVGAGLGGGSSDAAATLLGLNRLWDLRLAKAELLEIGAKLGSDVPFFMLNKSFCLGSGRGEVLKPVSVPIQLWHILVVPAITLSTKRVYEYFDRLKLADSMDNYKSLSIIKGRLTKIKRNVNILSPVFNRLKQEAGLGRELQEHYNSLECVAIRLAPQIAVIKEKLYSFGAHLVGMSGSGPTVFAVFSSRKEAQDLRARLVQFRHWRTFVARTC